ncbi:two-component regulator propeller domain-containing protein [uncultured Draconibacterium sp.]|uniref:ligand-binding sensor domain-containing protein n=1 Tax=uncultured Draconibacterium sp. TaxID=1573823 RepID=UPI0025E19C85|nr:sensor histidine kinase [uncultured Draconibacterium sp.]
MIVKQGHIGIIGILLIISFQINRVFAQPVFLPLHHLGTDEGLSSSSVTSIAQDKNGFIWIGTRKGLNRYDGDRFKTYQQDEKELQKNTLPDNLILSMCIGDNNRLFVGSNAGLSFYDPELDKLHNFKYDSTSCLYNIPIQARALQMDKNGSVYIASTDGIYYFNQQNNTVEHINNLGISVIDAVYLASDGRLWIGSANGLAVLNPETKEIERVVKGLDGEDYSKTRIGKIIEDHSGTIWAASFSHGLFMVEKKDNGENRLKNFRHNPNDAGSVSENRLLSLVVDKDNNIWVGAENDGIYCLNKNRQHFKHYLSTKSDPLVAKTYSGEYLFIDNGNNLWIGTYTSGVQIASEYGEAIVSYSKFKGGDLSNTNNMVNAFFELNDSIIALATDGGGVNFMNKNTGFFTNLSTTNSDLPNDYLLSIIEDDEGNGWLATWGSGLVRYDGKTEAFSTFDTENSPIPDDNLFDVCLGNHSDLLIATFNSGVARYFPKENRWEVFNDENSDLSSNYVNVIRRADDESFFIGTNSGLARYYPEDNSFTNCSLKKEMQTLSSAHIYDIFVESPTSVWVGSLSGLFHFNPKTGDTRTYTVNEGLPNNTVNGILKDADGFLWFSTSGGLCRYNDNQDVFDCYYSDDGLQSNEFRPRSTLIDSDNNLYFGGINGFSIIFPEKLKKNEHRPVVKFTELEIFNKVVYPNEPGSPLKRVISEVDEIKLPEKRSVLTFHFSVLDYASPSKNEHAYMLENFDKDWIYCGTRRQATYTNLDPGTYILRVKGANGDGLWNEKGIALKIIIVPPWWKSWWFVLILFVIFVGIFWFVNHLRIRSLEQQKQKLERAVARRTKELAEINATKDKLFSVIAHDLRNPFNVILGYTDVLIEGYHKFDKNMMEQILENLKTAGDGAFALLENLMNWSRSQRGVIEFTPKSIVLDDFIAVALFEVEAVAKKKGVAVENEIQDKSIKVFADYNMLLLIFRNLLTNAVKFSNPGSSVYIVKGKSDDGFITLGVRDEGIGMEPDKMKYLFQSEKQETMPGTKGEKGSGLGLMLCKEFIERHNGKIWVESSLGKGSVFWFTVPLNEKVFDK